MLTISCKQSNCNDSITIYNKVDVYARLEFGSNVVPCTAVPGLVNTLEISYETDSKRSYAARQVPGQQLIGQTDNDRRVTQGDNDPSNHARSKRQAQNRASYAYQLAKIFEHQLHVTQRLRYVTRQKAFRQRKQLYVKGLDCRILELENMNRQLYLENQDLKEQIKRLSLENNALKAVASTISSLPDFTPCNSVSPKVIGRGESSLLVGNQSLLLPEESIMGILRLYNNSESDYLL